MSTSSTVLDFHAAVDTAKTAPAKPGLLRRIFDGMIQSRLAHGEAHARAYLCTLSDERLADLGFAPDRIKAIRARDGAVNSYWL